MNDPAFLSSGYRWFVLVAVLLAGFLAGAVPSQTFRGASLGPVGVSVIATSFQFARYPWAVQRVALLLDVSVAALCIAVTGGIDSPFVLYLTVPAVVSAMSASTREVIALSSFSAVGFAVAVLVASDDPSAVVLAVDEMAMIVVIPALVSLSVRNAVSYRQTLALSAEDAGLLQSLARSLTYKEIADLTATSPESVKVAVSRIYRRLGVRSRAEATEVARRTGIIGPGAEKMW